MPAVDDRIFESAVDLTPEQEAANAAHFESKGLAYQVEKVEDDGQAKGTTEGTPTKDTAAAGEQPPAGSAAPAVGDDSIDPQDQADFQSAKTDGEKLGHYAKRTKKINELKATVEEKDRAYQEEKSKREELERKLAAQVAETPGPKGIADPAAPPPVEKPPVKAAEAAPAEEFKPKEFDEQRPKKPVLADFEQEADPYSAFAAAAADHAEKLLDWKDRKDKFDSEQKAEVAKNQRAAEETRNRQTSQKSKIQERWNEAQAEFPDLPQVLGKMPTSPILSLVFTERLKDGYKLAYQLNKPEHADLLKSLLDSTRNVDVNDPEAVTTAIEDSIASLAVFRKELAGSTKAKVVEPAAAAAAEAQPNGTGKPPEQALPSQPPPRREEASPASVRGRAGVQLRPEDVDSMDSDERRRLRKLQQTA